MRRHLLLIVIVLTCAVALSLAQDSPLPLTEGSVQGVIDDDNPRDVYRIEVEAGRVVTIRMDALTNALDPYLLLLDSEDQFFLDDDDSGDERNAQISFTTSERSTFTVEARRAIATTSGAYRLTLAISTLTPDTGSSLDQAPSFAVDFDLLAAGDDVSVALDETVTQQYYALGGQQGQSLRLTLLTIDGDLSADVAVFDPNLDIISRVSRNESAQKVVFVTLPQQGWYLIEITRNAGTGTAMLATQVIADDILNDDAPIQDGITDDVDERFYVFNATINEIVFINVQVEDDDFAPELAILDRNQTLLTANESQGTQTSVSLTIPRSGPYLVRVRSLGAGAGAYELALRRRPPNIDKLTVRPAVFNEDYSGLITDTNPIEYYRFSGKAGELWTIEMSPLGTGSALDPYLILADSSLNELAINDNGGSGVAARINQFALPVDGEYFVLVTRADLRDGTTTGGYRLTFEIGDIRLPDGFFSAELTWDTPVDLNLYVRDNRDGRTVSWANREIDTGGQLYIDSNTACETISSQPIEYIFWPRPLEPGDYTIWVWHLQHNNTPCSDDTADFTLDVNVGDTALFPRDNSPVQRLRPGQRYELTLRVFDDGRIVLADEGRITQPSAQQTASQAGDRLISYSQSVISSISDDVFAEFYQFEGRAGDTVRVTVEGLTANLDPLLVLRDDRDTYLAHADDRSATDRTAELVYDLERDGRYVLAVTRYGVRDGTTHGDYRLQLERVRD